MPGFSITDGDISDGNGSTPDGSADQSFAFAQFVTRPRRRRPSETWAPVAPVDGLEVDRRFQAPPLRPWRIRRLATPSQTDWTYAFIPTEPTGSYVENPQPRRLPP